MFRVEIGITTGFRITAPAAAKFKRWIFRPAIEGLLENWYRRRLYNVKFLADVELFGKIIKTSWNRTIEGDKWRN